MDGLHSQTLKLTSEDLCDRGEPVRELERDACLDDCCELEREVCLDECCSEMRASRLSDCSLIAKTPACDLSWLSERPT